MPSKLERRALRLAEKQHDRDQPSSSDNDDEHEDGKPAGGYDPTPLKPSGQTSYVCKFTFHRATNLPVSDLHGLASDPYCMVQLDTPSLPKRHKDDPPLRFRTRTHHTTTNPVWDDEWIVGGVPESGVVLNIRIMDEDRMNKDDRLGDVNIVLNDIGSSQWTDITEQPFEIKKKHASKRANLMRAAATVIHPVQKALFHHSLRHDDAHYAEELYISVEVLEKMSPDQDVGKAYTLGPCRWFQHYSPLIGRMVGTKDGASDTEDGGQRSSEGKANGKGNKTERFDFQANEIQLRGPVPNELYHRYVNFKPFVHGMFQRSGIRGTILNHMLHHQHAKIYQYDSDTKYGSFPSPSVEGLTAKFLDLVHYDQGARIFTYVITLDGLLRFTETGSGFQIDLLSKHTMHAAVASYIAWSGEFLIRRLKHPGAKEEEGTHPSDPLPGGPPKDEPPKNPKTYEAIFDNDSGTYRPNKDLIPIIKGFLERNFPGLRIVMYDCNDEKLKKIKKQQAETRKKEGDQRTFVQHYGSDSSSDEDGISSDDESDLERRAKTADKGKSGGKMERAFDLLHLSKRGQKE